MLKVPLPEMETDPVLLERFKREQGIGQELDPPETLGVEEGAQHPSLHQRLFPGGRKMILYALLALLPILIFGFMIVLAKR